MNGRPAFVFQYKDGKLGDSKYVRNSSCVPSTAMNLDGMAVVRPNGEFFEFYEGWNKGEGYYISENGETIQEWDLYEHMSLEDGRRYDVLYGVAEDEFGNVYLTDENLE